MNNIPVEPGVSLLLARESFLRAGTPMLVPFRFRARSVIGEFLVVENKGESKKSRELAIMTYG